MQRQTVNQSTISIPVPILIFHLSLQSAPMSLFKRCFDLFNEFHCSAQYFNFVSVVSQWRTRRRRGRQTEGKDKQSERTHLKVEAGKCFQMRQYLRIHTYTYKMYIDKVCRETY